METDRNPQQVLTQVRNLICDIIGQNEDINNQEISLETSFNKDLELESIEFVVLSEKLQQTYGNDINFAQWLANKELDEIIQLQVKDIVNFISTCPN